MKKAVFVAAAFLAVVVLATPVLAIGPWEAFEVGNNKNLGTFAAALGNTRGNAGGSIYWFWVEADQHWVRWQFQDPRQAKGLMNKAFVAPQYSGAPTGLPAYFSALDSAQYDNDWIYLSGDGATYPSQYNGHGMLYWFVFGISRLGGASIPAATAAAVYILSQYPTGELWKHDDIFAPQ